MDVAVTLPEGWEQLDIPDGPLTYSPDGGSSVLQLSIPWWAFFCYTADDAALLEMLTNAVGIGALGTIGATAWSNVPYGRALRAEVISDEHADVMAWLVIPPEDAVRKHDVVLVTWIAGEVGLGDTAIEIIDTLRMGLFTSAITWCMAMAREALLRGDIAPHAMLYGNGAVTRISLSSLPEDSWNTTCRIERANRAAEVVVQVRVETLGGTVYPVIYAESATRYSNLVVYQDGFDHHDEPRMDFFAALDRPICGKSK
jgi:hypothetical protein